MKSLRLAVLLSAAAWLLVSCSREDALQEPAHSLLALVPADTPYVFANLQPVPADIMDAWLQRAEPFLVELQLTLDEARQDFAERQDGVDPDFAAIADAVLAELDGKLSRAGLESLGFALDAGHVVYGNGLFPVLRLGLGDAEALRAAVARVEANSGHPIPELSLGEDAYWRIVDDEHALAAYIAILDDHVAISAAPLSVEAEFLPGFLGQAAPAENLGDGQALAVLNRDKGFTPYGSGYLDTNRVLDELLDPASRTAAYLAALDDDYDPASLDPACTADARRISAAVPRMVAGVTELDANAVNLRYQVEFERSLALELVDLVSDVPPASQSADNLLAASLAIRVGRLREFARMKANALAAAPFACPKLQDLNDSVQQMAAQLNQPMPLPIGNLMGLRAELHQVDFTDPQPATTRGLLSLEVENPQMLIGTASMMIPGFEELGIEPGAEPVEIPQELLSVVTPDVALHAVMTKRAIGLSFGEGMNQQLVPFMQGGSDGNEDGAFVSLDYDMAALARLQAHHADEGDALDERQQRLLEAYQAIAGRSRLVMGFREDGLTIDSRTSMK